MIRPESESRSSESLVNALTIMPIIVSVILDNIIVPTLIVTVKWKQYGFKKKINVERWNIYTYK